jgi:hypothetical protein
MSRVAGQLVSLSASASGAPAPAVQWQVSSNGGATWTNIPGGTTPTITFRTAAADNGRQFRAVFSNAAGTAASAAAQLTIRPAPVADIDDDFKTDLVVWRPSSGTWFTLTSGSSYAPASARATPWGGASGDQPLLGDLEGDGVADLIIWNVSTGNWTWLLSSTGYATSSAGSKQWGNSSLGDRPMLGDIDGDGRADLILWRASTGTWFWLLSSADYAYSSAGGVQWGNNSLGDVPLLGDFDGDGRSDPAVWRASSGTWFWLLSTRGYATNAAASRQWGNQAAGDTPIVGDLDGDGRTELTVWRASTGTWFWLSSSTQYATAASVQWGNQAAGDRPLLGDFDGDGRGDVAVWRASTGTWFWLSSSSNFATGAARSRQWGSPTDVPVVK